MEIQITQATITPKCREQGDVKALNIATDEIRQKIIMAMNADANDKATFQIVAILKR